jgi:N-acetylneuraminic acid mutarotase
MSVRSFRFIAALSLILLPGVLMSSRAASGDDLIEFHWKQLPSLPNSPGVASPFAGLSHGMLLVAGGANFPDAPPWKNGTKVWHKDIYALNVSSSKAQADHEWKIVGQLPRPCAYGVSILFDDRVICAGGSDSMSHHRDVFQLEWTPTGLKTEVLPMQPRPIANACGALSGTTLYLAGGTESPTSTIALSNVYALDLASTPLAWKELPPCPGPGRILAVAAATRDAFYLFSGAALNACPDGKPARTYLKDAWRFDLATHQWKQLADLPSPTVAAPSPAPVAANQSIIILGGDDGTRVGFQPPEEHPGFLQHALLYHPKNNTWTTGPSLQISRVTIPVAAIPGGWMIPSGEQRPGIRSPEVWQLSISP